MKSRFTRAVVWSLAVVVAVPALAYGAGEGRSLLMGNRNPSHGDVSRETQIISRNGSYSTRQSNMGSGGGAIYGCRATVGAEPCVRANNLREGRAFEFETQSKEGGRITVKDSAGTPFTTNATGKVANLNADKLDDKDAEDFAAAGDLLFAVVADGGTLVAGDGATASSRSGDATTVTFGRDVSKCSYTATANGTTPQALAAQAVAGHTDQVLVSEDAAPPAVAFHLQVIC